MYIIILYFHSLGDIGLLRIVLAVMDILIEDVKWSKIVTQIGVGN